MSRVGALALPNKPYYVEPGVKAFFAEHAERLRARYDAWTRTFEAWKTAKPALAAELAVSRAFAHTSPHDTRQKTQDVNTLFESIDHYLGKDATQNLVFFRFRERVPRADLEPPLRRGRSDHHGRGFRVHGRGAFYD